MNEVTRVLTQFWTVLEDGSEVLLETLYDVLVEPHYGRFVTINDARYRVESTELCVDGGEIVTSVVYVSAVHSGFEGV